MRRHRSRGVTMVELLVGSAVGLLVAAAAAAVVSAHHVEARRLQTEARLTQDLRATAALLVRDLRRAGHWSDAASAVRGGDAAVAANPHAPIVVSSGGGFATVALSFSTGAAPAGAVADAERFGFRLRGGVVEVQLGLHNWQALSDPGTLVVTSFSVEPRVDEVSLASFCDAPCAAGSTVCPPRQQVRSFAVAIAGRAPNDAAVSRSLRTAVRVRNDAVVGSCAG